VFVSYLPFFSLLRLHSGLYYTVFSFYNNPVSIVIGHYMLVSFLSILLSIPIGVYREG
jgi:hypothetical protein